MWLLRSATAELKYFNSPEDVPGGYAILSHVWDAPNEKSFQDMQRIISECARDGTNPRDRASPKIQDSCKLAELWGLDWIWNDTCCIDRTSSVELSEAINSMFRYYSLAQVCFAYLQDVPTPEKREMLRAPGSAFRRSKWHTRGWTLQELIAPHSLIFLSQTWVALGTKTDRDLARVLQEITGIPIGILRHKKQLGEISVAQRMSWASHRQTTRVEDEGYCLMGIFDIGMPVLYGEGRRAFRRVQEEIMKVSKDPTLFAWGLVRQPKVPRPGVQRCKGPGWLDMCMDHAEESFLLAPSPQAFMYSRHVHDTIGTFRVGSQLEEYARWIKDCLRDLGLVDVLSGDPASQLPTFATTPYGIRARLPVIELQDCVIAVLFCATREQDASGVPQQQHLGVKLLACKDASSNSRSCPMFCVAQSPRWVALDDCWCGMACFCGISAQWREIYIADYYLPPAVTVHGKSFGKEVLMP